MFVPFMVGPGIGIAPRPIPPIAMPAQPDVAPPYPPPQNPAPPPQHPAARATPATASRPPAARTPTVTRPRQWFRMLHLLRSVLLRGRRDAVGAIRRDRNGSRASSGPVPGASPIGSAGLGEAGRLLHDG